MKNGSEVAKMLAGEDVTEAACMQAEQLLNGCPKKKGTDMKAISVVGETFMESRYAELMTHWDGCPSWVFRDLMTVEKTVVRLSNWSKMLSNSKEPSVSGNHEYMFLA